MIAIFLIASLIVLELTLRILGFEPWRYQSYNSDRAAFNEFDPVRGWRNKPGSYEYPGFSDEVKSITLNIDETGSRVTANHVSQGEINIAVVGGSWAHGWALSDDQTFAWKLQQQFPNARLFNYASGGYGTYQSLLTAKEVSRINGISFDVVIYGYMGDHPKRNVAPASWFELLSKSSRRNHVWVPYCEFEKHGEFVCREIEKYSNWPSREYSALTTALERLYAQFKDGQRLSYLRPVTERLFIEFHKLMASDGGKFIVALLTKHNNHNKWDYRNFLKENNIEYVDCGIELTVELKIKGEGHPNERANQDWAKCIQPKLKRLLRIPN